MPINVSLAQALRKKYGSERGERIYYAMESEGSPAFRRGLRTATREGRTAQRFPGRARRKRRGSRAVRRLLRERR